MREYGVRKCILNTNVATYARKTDRRNESDQIEPTQVTTQKRERGDTDLLTYGLNLKKGPFP